MKWGLLYFCSFVLFADFFVPYSLNENNFTTTLKPPTKIHFWYKKKLIGPFFYHVLHNENNKKIAIPIKIRFFVKKSYTYKILGLFPCSYRFFGPESDYQNPILYLLGSDQFGRDILSRIVLSGRISLLIAISAALLSTILGSYIGSASILGKKFTQISLQTLTELLQGLPQILLLFILGTFISSKTSLWKQCLSIITFLGILNWVRFSKLTHSLVYEIQKKEFILAAVMMGANQSEILHKHIFPHIRNQQVISFLNLIPSMLIAESTLSFFGLGIREPFSSWGTMLRLENTLVQLTLSPWLLYPGLAIILANFFIHMHTKKL